MAVLNKKPFCLLVLIERRKGLGFRYKINIIRYALYLYMPVYQRSFYKSFFSIGFSFFFVSVPVGKPGSVLILLPDRYGELYWGKTYLVLVK